MGVREQPAEKMQPRGRQAVARIADESVAAAFAVDQRHMQMPARGEHIGQRRPAHEACQKTMAPRDLLRRGAEQHHGIGGLEAKKRPERELALARPELDFERAQRQAERGDAPADRC